MIIPEYWKDPDAVSDYTINWGKRWLAEDTIVDSQWIVPSGINMESSSNTTKTTTVWLSGGTEGEIYDVVNRITTNGGRIQDMTLRIHIKEQ